MAFHSSFSPMIEWSKVKRVLVVRLRSIGDTVLATPSLIALKRFLPDAEVDILLEDWVAPVMSGFDAVNNVISVKKGTLERLRTARLLRDRHYDVALNLHGGTTATFFTLASGAPHRVGISNYRYSFLYNHLLPSPADFWQRHPLHSAEQQLALLGHVGVPVEDLPKSHLIVEDKARESVAEKLGADDGSPVALLHPSTAFFTKQWPVANYAITAEYLHGRGCRCVAIASKPERAVLADLARHCTVPIETFDNLSLPEITALAARAQLFVGNDSGIAHIAAAVGTPSVIIFGSSNRSHWRPWTDAPNEIVFEEFACQPCPGYTCELYGKPRCILSIQPDAVIAAIEKMLRHPSARGLNLTTKSEISNL